MHGEKRGELSMSETPLLFYRFLLQSCGTLFVCVFGQIPHSGVAEWWSEEGFKGTHVFMGNPSARPFEVFS